MENQKYLYFIFLSYFVLKGLYILTDKILQNNKNYLLLFSDRKLYVIKNLIKSIILVSISIFDINTISEILFHGIYTKESIIRIAIIYGINDTYGLINVPGLNFSTKIHHSVTTILCISTLFYDYENLGYIKGIIYYALFSILSGSVNGYLSYRFIFPKSEYRFFFKRFAYYNYLICFISEWLYQYYVIMSYLFDYSYHNYIYHTGFLLYFCCIHLIMYDDIKLIEYLRKDARKYKN